MFPVSLSLIVPVYNVEQYIERCMESIINQTDTQFELVLVDDCGTDNSMQLAESILASSNIDFKIFKRKSNGGLSAARNSGISIATGEYFYFVDSDDDLPLDAVAIIKNTISQHPAIEVFYFNANYWHNEKNEFVHFLESETPNLKNSKTFLQQFLQGKYLAYIWMYVFKRNIFENIHFPDGAVYEDALTVPYILKSTKDIFVDLNQVIYHYYVRQGSISRSFHPQLKNVIPAFQLMEQSLFKSDDELNAAFVDFRTTYLMRLSRESFTRAADPKEAIALHKYWISHIPSSNITTLWKSGKRKSAIFVKLLKLHPSIIGYLYKLKLLK